MILFLLSALTAVESDYGICHLFQLRFPSSLINTLIAHTVLLICFPNDALRVGKGLIFVQLIFIAAIFDALTYKIPDWIHVLILLDGLALINPMDSLVGFFLISTLFLLLTMVTGGGIGGGDIKLMAACGFVLGSIGIVLATFFSIMLMLPVNFKWFFHCKDRRREYAMAPYLAVGCFFSYLFL